MKRFRLIYLSALCLMVGITVGSANNSWADTWAERLGFPADKKVVILHAYQMGLCRATNAAAEKLAESGLVFSSCGMVPCPWFDDFAKSAPGDAGICFSINSEWPNYRWQPLSPDHDVASLTDPMGYFWKTSVQTMVNAEVAEVERELRHQLIRARLAGLKPTHLTTHLGTLYTRLDLTEAYLRLAREFWIPAVVVELTPEHIERFRAQGFPLPPELVSLVHDYPLPKVDELFFVIPDKSYEQTKAGFIEQLESLEPGITQIAFEPALESDELKHIVHGWQNRVWQTKLMQDAEVRQRLQSDEIILTTWHELMQRYTGEAPGVAPQAAEGEVSAASAEGSP